MHRTMKMRLGSISLRLLNFCPCKETDLNHMSSDTDSSSSAEKSIQVHIDKVDLYEAKTKHEKRLLRCVKDLSSFVAGQLKVEDKNEFWLTFRAWIKENSNAASQYADQYIAQYLNQHSANVSCCHTLRLHIQVFLRWDVEVSLSVREQVNRLDREQYLPAKIVRFNTHSTNKTSQFERFEMCGKNSRVYDID